MTSVDPLARDILDFWFGEPPPAERGYWFRKDSAFDAAIRDRFGATIAADTGLSKASAQRAVALLKRRKLLATAKSTPTSVPEYRVARPWVGRIPA